MYSVKLDDNNYFTGNYAEIGSVDGGMDVESLPEDLSRAICYRYDHHDVVCNELVPVVDPETGETTYEETPVTRSVLGWVFDEAKYQQFLADEAAKVVPPTTEEQLAVLQAENEMLKGCVMELAAIVYA